jgi:hypothetical protein
LFELFKLPGTAARHTNVSVLMNCEVTRTENGAVNGYLNTLLLISVWKRKESEDLTPLSSVLLEKLIGTQLLRTFPVFYQNRRLIAVFTTARHWFIP